jgi:filamentous hemagglutinin family protein
MGARIIVGGSFGLLGLLLGAMPGLGQSITLDGTVGPIRPLGNGPSYAIRQTDGTTVRTNLFHSFGRFNLATGERAVFQSSATIQTILARVTGGTTSSIDGAIVTNSGAVNLFLINPAGIVFGPNASLDIGGTTRGDFTATTLDAITWSDGSQFNAVNPEGRQPLLRIIGEPNGFLSSQRVISGITVNQSLLQVSDSQDLRLLGGDVRVTGGELNAWTGRVDIGAIKGAGRIGLLGSGGFLVPSGLSRGGVTFRNDSSVDVTLGDRGDITVTGQDIQVLSGSILKTGIERGLGTATSQAGSLTLDATGTVRVSGNLSQVANQVGPGSRGGGGALNIRAKEVLVTDGGVVSTTTFGRGDAGNLQISGRDRILFQNGSLISSDVEETGIGRGGTVVINSPILDVRDSAQITANTYGKGNAGNVQITAPDRVTLQGGSPNGQFSSAIGSVVVRGGIGKGGDITINTAVLEVLNGSQISTSTDGRGDGGNVRISARDRALFQDGGSVFSDVGFFGVGKGGDVVIDTTVLDVRGGAQLTSSTAGQGDAGNVLLTARDRVLFQGRSADDQFGSDAFSRVEITGQGNSGDIVINTAVLEVRDGAQLVANTRGLGDAGTIRINARDRTTFQNGVALSDVRTTGAGRGGTIIINTAVLEMLEGAGLQAGTDGIGDAGNIRIKASDRAVFQGVNPAGESTLVFSRVDRMGIGNGGNITIDSPILEVRDGAQLLANSRGIGNAGNINILARDNVLVDGVNLINGRSSLIFTSNGTFGGTVGTGAAGNIELTTSQLTVSKGGAISASTVNEKSGGNITINVADLRLIEGGQILSTSSDRGPAATIRINATDGIRIAGNDPTYADRLARFSTAVLPITANSGIYVRSTATGAAGNVIIGDRGTTPSLFLDGGEIIADSNAVTGGNINLTLNQFLFMQNSSLISATAGRAQGSGDGGNITINSPFALAVPQENNDIIANAFSGSGGNITINADAILNFTLNDKGKSFEQLRSQPTNDISASSQFGSNGTLNLAGLNVDPSRGSVQLPIGLVDNADRINTPCLATSKTSQGSFIITGRGGLVASPDSWRGAVPSSDWLSLAPGTIQATQATVSTSAAQPSPVLEANEWQRTPQGQIQFIAASATLPRYQHPDCATTFAPLAEE